RGRSWRLPASAARYPYLRFASSRSRSSSATPRLRAWPVSTDMRNAIPSVIPVSVTSERPNRIRIPCATTAAATRAGSLTCCGITRSLISCHPKCGHASERARGDGRLDQAQRDGGHGDETDAGEIAREQDGGEPQEAFFAEPPVQPAASDQGAGELEQHGVGQVAEPAEEAVVEEGRHPEPGRQREQADPAREPAGDHVRVHRLHELAVGDAPELADLTRR